jgi:hypothetical protein
MWGCDVLEPPQDRGLASQTAGHAAVAGPFLATGHGGGARPHGRTRSSFRLIWGWRCQGRRGECARARRAVMVAVGVLWRVGAAKSRTFVCARVSLICETAGVSGPRFVAASRRSISDSGPVGGWVTHRPSVAPTRTPRARAKTIHSQDRCREVPRRTGHPPRRHGWLATPRCSHHLRRTALTHRAIR